MEIDKIIKWALAEDIGSGDVTSSLLPKGEITAILRAKEEGIICGMDIVQKMLKIHDSKIKFEKFVADGKRVRPNDIIAKISGNSCSILSCERTMLNFLQRLSGIATSVNRFAMLVKPYGVKILDTRKTTPLLRELEKYAVKTGGGFNHRFGLYDMVLIKDNHIEIIGSIKQAVKDARKKYPKMKVEVEVENLEMVQEAIDSQADIIMLDNMEINMMKMSVSLIRSLDKKIEIEASGGIGLSNIVEVAKTGIDFISIGSELTNNLKSLDISLDI